MKWKGPRACSLTISLLPSHLPLTGKKESLGSFKSEFCSKNTRCPPGATLKKTKDQDDTRLRALWRQGTEKKQDTDDRRPRWRLKSVLRAPTSTCICTTPTYVYMYLYYTHLRLHVHVLRAPTSTCTCTTRAYVGQRGRARNKVLSLLCVVWSGILQCCAVLGLDWGAASSIDMKTSAILTQ